MRSSDDGPENSITKEEIEEQMEKKLQGFLEQMVATLRGKVKSTTIEIVKGSSLGLSTANLVESHNASSILVYSRSTEEELLDPEVELLSRLVPHTNIFIVWN